MITLPKKLDMNSAITALSLGETITLDHTPVNHQALFVLVTEESSPGEAWILINKYDDSSQVYAAIATLFGVKKPNYKFKELKILNDSRGLIENYLKREDMDSLSTYSLDFDIFELLDQTIDRYHDVADIMESHNCSLADALFMAEEGEC